MNARWLLLGVALGLAPPAGAGDWPQWRGPNRDGRAVGFTAPAAWPKELAKKWQAPVGDGVATPALVGDKLYVFSRQGTDEVTRCLDAATGKDVWKDKNGVGDFRGRGDSGFPGPRASPAVAGGRVVTLGVLGTLSCLDAATGAVVWRKDDYKGSVPMFHTSSSPLIADGLCVAQLGAGKTGAVVAYDLATGAEKWKWPGESPAYASPVLLTVGGTKAVVAETERSIVALALADGALLWQTPYPVPPKAQGGRPYNASTPMADGDTLIYSGSGRGTRAVKVREDGGKLAATELWSNREASVQFNTPVARGGLVFGLTDRDSLFCLDAKTGTTAWTAPLGGGGRRPGYGSVVDAGPVLFALTPAGKLVAFEPSAKEFKEVASYKVAAGDTYAYPVVSGNRVFVKDKESVTLLAIE